MFEKTELDSLYKYCITLENDPDHAYDLLYNSLEKFYRRPPNIPKAKFGYIRKIIRNTWIDNLRLRRPNIQELPDQSVENKAYLIVDSHSPEDEMVNEQKLASVWASLSSEEKEILFLWFFEELSMEEISKHMKIPKNTIVSKIYRMRRRLRSQEKENDFNMKPAVGGSH